MSSSIELNMEVISRDRRKEYYTLALKRRNPFNISVLVFTFDRNEKFIYPKYVGMYVMLHTCQ